MMSILILLSLCLPAAEGPRRLDGAFIQLDRKLARQSPEQWTRVLERMREADLRVVIVQYAVARWRDRPATAASFLPSGPGESDPISTILEYADAHPEMSVFLGLRYDARLFRSEVLNDPVVLREALADELPRNIDLARRLAERYRLKSRRSFAGWYLPLELANYSETAAKREDGWVHQVSRFTFELGRACKELADRPTAASPYFNGRIKGRSWLVPPHEMGTMFARFLKTAGLSIVMLQDGVGVARVQVDDVEDYVLPYLVEIARACEQASAPGREIELWLNVESIGADIERLEKQIAMGQGRAARLVTFDFPNYLNKQPLYDDYVRFLQGKRRRP